jgi:hypothetical protein
VSLLTQRYRPAGPTGRRLAMCPLPLPGESLLSWIDQVAESFSVPRRGALEVLGLHAEPRLSLRCLVVNVPDTVAAEVFARTGLEPKFLVPMTLARYAVVDPMTLRTLSQPWWWSVDFSPACAACIADSGGRWQTDWRLASMVCCPRHHCYLINTCPCGRRLHRLTHCSAGCRRCSGQQFPGPLSFVRDRYPCPGLIADMAAVPVMDPGVEVAQQQILALSSASQDPAWTALQWLELNWLCVLICWVGAEGLVDDCGDGRLVEEFTAFCRRRDATPPNLMWSSYWGSDVVDNSVVMAAVMKSAARLVFVEDVSAQADGSVIA